MFSLFKQGMSVNDMVKVLVDCYLQVVFLIGGCYNVDQVILLLCDGDLVCNFVLLGNWMVKNGVFKFCLLGLIICWEDGLVWIGYRMIVIGQGLGLFDGLFGLLVGGLLINCCDSLFGNLIDYNGCVCNNLVFYIQIVLVGFFDGVGGMGVINFDGSVSCSGLLCILLKLILVVL